MTIAGFEPATHVFRGHRSATELYDRMIIYTKSSHVASAFVKSIRIHQAVLVWSGYVIVCF